MKHRTWTLGLLSSTMLVFSLHSAFAEDEVPAPGTPPEKAEADEKPSGIEPGLRYIADGFTNLSGGAQQSARFTHNISGTLALDGDTLIGAKGLRAFVNVMHNGGGQPDGDLVGTYGVYDNIEASPQATRLEEAWVEQDLYDGRASVKVGVVDVNSEFYLTEASARFIHSTFGIGSEFALGGQAGPPTFPLTALSARVMVQPTEESYVMASVLDGLPGDPDQPRGTHLHIGGHDGALLMTEAGWTPGKDGDSVDTKLALGAWTYTHDIDQFIGTDSITGNPLTHQSYGFYGLAQRKLQKADAKTGAREIEAFARLGYADPETTLFDWAGSIGFVVAQPMHDPEGSEFGLGCHAAHKSSDFREASLAAGSPQSTWESGAEMYYRWQALPWVALQPDFQYLTNPEAIERRSDAVVAGLRLDASF